MSFRSALLSTLTLVLAVACVPSAAHSSGDLNMTATATSATQISLVWNWEEFDTGNPVLYPEWVGYDLYRRSPADCSPWIRLNAEILPRVPGQSHGGSYMDTPPATLVTWEYKLETVQADREHASVLQCEAPCVPHAWESIPTLAGPVTEAKVAHDIGWAVILEPCAGSCWYSFTVSGPTADLLRPYLGTGQAFRFYGQEVFGMFEGSPLDVDHFEPIACGSVPNQRPTWGRLKTLYR